jgi:uncharacterized membrane protein YeaQ/YmgE (transglycosylase-associated protein family)
MEASNGEKVAERWEAPPERRPAPTLSAAAAHDRGTGLALTGFQSIAAARSEVQMGLLLFILFGLVVGFLARAILPGRQSMGLIMTAILGMVGSLLGGFVGSMVAGDSINRVHSAGLIGSVLGALLVLALATMGGRRARI